MRLELIPPKRGGDFKSPVSTVPPRRLAGKYTPLRGAVYKMYHASAFKVKKAVSGATEINFQKIYREPHEAYRRPSVLTVRPRTLTPIFAVKLS